MTIDDLRAQNCLLLECISGSTAYNLNTPTSDIDIKGVYILPKEKYFGLEYIPQISNETNDIVFYELGRFIELLCKNNPNILEMLAVDEEFILYKHPIMDLLSINLFLSKRCKETFGSYAAMQVKRARGLKKKIVNPLPPERKNILHFCYILEGYGAISLNEWLDKYQISQLNCGLVHIPHTKEMYAVFHEPTNAYHYEGIMKKETATNLKFSSIPKGEKEIAYLFFNHDAFSMYCREYREYWEWVEKRNETRYESTLNHGKNYDAKNMMHTFRLLQMAEEILEQGKVIVNRPNRAELLSIKAGEFEFDELLFKAEEKIKHIDKLYETSTLPDAPNIPAIEKILIEMRSKFYLDTIS